MENEQMKFRRIPFVGGPFGGFSLWCNVDAGSFSYTEASDRDRHNLLVHNYSVSEEKAEFVDTKIQRCRVK